MLGFVVIMGKFYLVYTNALWFERHILSRPAQGISSIAIDLDSTISRGHLLNVTDKLRQRFLYELSGNMTGGISMIDRMFKGRADHQVLINRDNNRDLLLSIETAGVYNGKKDKRGEKLAETEEDKLENRTDGSDAFDTLCIGVEKFPKLQLRMTGGVVSSFGRA